MAKNKTKNSRSIGKTTELAFCRWLEQWALPDGRPITARRGQQYKGTKDSPDIITNMGAIHWEVTRDEHIGVSTDFLKFKCCKAWRDAGSEAIPRVAWREPRKPWMVTRIEGWIDGEPLPSTMLAEDFMRLLNCRRRRDG